MFTCINRPVLEYGTNTSEPEQNGDPDIVPVVIDCATTILTKNKFMSNKPIAKAIDFLNPVFILKVSLFSLFIAFIRCQISFVSIK